MAAGQQLTLADVNSQLGNISMSLNSLMDRIQLFNTWYQTVGGAGLQALGMSAADAATAGSAITDMTKLANIYVGAATQASAYDFRTFVKLVDGFGF